jgi:Cft2 family RNA processing exonuclease
LSGAVNVLYRRGVYLPEIDFWLDPKERKPVAFVSHAHSDHIGNHGRVLTTVGTAALMRHRLRGHGRYETLAFGQTHEFEGFRLTLYPAGHVLGSAQALVETEAGRLLYSGDFKLRPGLAAEPIEVPQADVLVMETTFGRPGYVFPPTEQVVAGIRAFCSRAIAEGRLPILYAYALGKGPELLAQLAGCEWDLVLHPALFDVVKICEELGVRFPPHRRLEDASSLAGEGVAGDRPCVLIAPPGAARGRALQAIRHRRTAYVSGWGIDRSAAYRHGVDACFPLSDHADYPDLLEYVRLTGARRILTLHGFDVEFARDLRLLGYDAQSLAAPVQLSLF